MSRARPMTTSGAWRKRCRATPTRSLPNARAKSSRSNRRSGRYRNSTGKAEPFAERFGSIGSWPRPGSRRPICGPRSTGFARRPVRSSCLRSRRRRRSPRMSGSTSGMRLCFADGRRSRERPNRSTQRPASRRWAGWPRSKATASAIIRSPPCSMAKPAANGRPWTNRNARNPGGKSCHGRRLGPSATAADSTMSKS